MRGAAARGSSRMYRSLKLQLSAESVSAAAAPWYVDVTIRGFAEQYHIEPVILSMYSSRSLLDFPILFAKCDTG